MREKINEAIQKQKDIIKQAEDTIISLRRESYLLNDDKQWFTEAMETHTEGRGKKKVSEDFLIGRINWIERFDDYIEVGRSKVVRVNGEWI